MLACAGCSIYAPVSVVPIVAPGCRERDSIIAEIRKVIDRITAIHNAELESVIAGISPRDESVEHSLKELRELKALLMERLSCHCEEHGC